MTTLQWLMLLLFAAAAAATLPEHHQPGVLPLCPADIFCTDCKASGGGGKWSWDDDDDQECVRDCFGVCDGDAIKDACGVCGGDGSDCTSSSDDGSSGCDKECQTILIVVGSVLLALLLILLLWFILAGPGRTILVPAGAGAPAKPVARPLLPTQRRQNLWHRRLRRRTRPY